MNKRGIALIVAMSFLTLLFIGGSSYVSMVTHEARHTERQIDNQKAFLSFHLGGNSRSNAKFHAQEKLQKKDFSHYEKGNLL